MNIFKASLYNFISVSIQMVCGLFATKIIAFYTGPVGLAFIGQMRNVLDMMVPFSNGGIGNGIVKYVAEFNASKRVNQLRAVISTSLFLTFLCSTFFAIVLFFIRKPICLELFGSKDLSWVFVFFSFSIPAMALGSSLLSVLNGYKKVKEYAYVGAINSAVSFCLIILLVGSFGTAGALLALIFSQASLFFVVLGFLYREGNLAIRRVSPAFERNIATDLFKYSLMGLTSAIMGPLSQMVVRTYIMKNLSVAEAGYWHGVWRFSDIYLSVITLSLGVYYLPRLSEINEKEEFIREIVKTMIFSLSVAVIASVVIYPLRRVIILALFTDDFMEMGPLFLFQLTGNVLKIASWTLGMIMWARALTGIFITTEIVFSGSFVFFSVFFIKKFHLIGVTYAYAFNYLIYLIFLIVYFSKWLKFKSGRTL